MKLWAVLSVFGVLLSGPMQAQTRVERSLARLPLYFEPDQGGFLAHAAGGTLELAADSVRGTVALRLDGARRNARMEGVERLASESHYLIGNDPKKWRTHVPNYARVRVRDAWPGIDVVYYGNGNRRELEFDFVVAAGADPSRIQFVTDGGRLRDPVIYQDAKSGRQIVAGHYSRRGSRVAFELAAYDHRRPLVIDPVIEYSTALGGGAYDSGNAIAVDDRGAAYIFGVTYSGNFPVTSAFQSNPRPGRRLFVAKLAPGGGALEYSTYLGGTLGGNQYNGDNAGGIAVDASGTAYLTGTTAAPDFPVAGPAPLQKTFITFGQNGFAARLSADGSALVYSTYLGNSAGGPANRVAVDRSGNAYLTGQANSIGFPLVNPMPTPFSQFGGSRLYVVKLRPDGTAVYSTFLGSGNSDNPTGIAADNDGNAYVTGSTYSPDFPLVNPLQGQRPSINSPFVAKLNSSGSALIYSTYFGGGGGNDRINAIAVDASGNAYVAGMTNSNDFPTANPLQARLAGATMYKSTDGGATSIRSDVGLPASATAVAVDRANSTLYAMVTLAYPNGNWLYRSTDAGGSWESILPHVSAFAVDPSASGTLYAGTSGDANSKASIGKSTDRGTTWSTLSNQFAQALVIDSANPTTLYAGVGGSNTGDGVYKSSDGGSTWAPMFTGAMHGVHYLAIDPAASTLYVITGRSGFQRSTDGGQTWSSLPNLPANTYPSSIAFDPGNSGTFYIPAYSQPGNVLLKTTDGGQSFTSSTVGANGATSIAVDSKNSATLYAATSTGVLKSTDGGQNWNPTAIIGSVNTVVVDPASNVYAAEYIQPDAFVAKLNPQGTALVYSTYLGGVGTDYANAIAVDSAGNAYVAGFADSADFPSKNPLTPALTSGGNQFLAKLNPSGSGLVYSTRFIAAVNGLAVDSAGAVYLTGSTNRTDFPTRNPIQLFTTGTFFRSSDGGQTWTGNPSGDAFRDSILNLAMDPRNSSLIFAQTSSKIYRSTDGGATFNALKVPFSNILSIALDPLSSALYAGTGSGSTFGIYQSTDEGQSWSRIGGLSMVNAIAISPKSAGTIFAATDGGLFKSTDGGANWDQSGSFYQVYAVIFDPQDSQTLYASSAFDGVFKSTNGGASWTAINNGFPNSGGPAAKVLAGDPFNRSVIYAAGRDGIFRSMNGGANWSAIDSGLRVRQGFWVSTFALDPVTPSTLYAGLDSGGLYKSTDGGASWNLSGLALPAVSAIVADPSGPGRVIAGTYFNPSDAFIMKLVE